VKVFLCEAEDILVADAPFNQEGIETGGKKLKATMGNVTS
jgi:hypothetical protein